MDLRFASAALVSCVVAVPAIAQVPPASFDCLIEANESVNVGSHVTGVLESVPIERGDFIKKGDVVGKLHSEIELASVNLARRHATSDVNIRASESRLQGAIKKMERAKKLHQKNVISEQQYDDLATELELRKIELEAAKEQTKIAKLELERAEAILESRTIRSPIDGVVVSRSLSAGEYVFSDNHIATIAKIDPLNVEVFVPTILKPKIHVGMVATVIPEVPYEQNLNGTVTVVDSVLDSASGTFGVRLRLPNSDRKIPAGLRCKVRFFVNGT